MSGAQPKDGLRVLSFDGPPIPEAALSELFFLQQIAHRWAFNEDEDGDEIEGDDVRVSDMFDIIGGCGLGGLYAILFARLNMTIGQVIQFHNLLTQRLFAAPCWTQVDHQECTNALDGVLDQTVSHLGTAVDLNSPFQSKECKKCLVVVLNTTTPDAHSPRLLRSYRVRVGSSPRCTIRQALHATIADLEHLPAVVIEDEHFIRVSDVSPNPSRIFMKDLAATLPKLHLACLVNVGADRTQPPNDSHTVGQDLMTQFRSLGCFFRLSVREKLDAGSKVRSLVIGYLQEDDISKVSEDIVDAVKDRKPVVNLLRLGDLAGQDGKHALQAGISQLRNEGEMKRALKMLHGPFDFSALYDHGCLEGTRVDVLEQIEEWSKDPNAPTVFWLEGHPGTGKTFISISLKQRLAEAGLLGASCFFRREDASHHRLDTLVRSIASQLASKPGFVQDAVVQAVNSDVVKFDGAPANLFTQLLYDPLTTACAESNKSIVIVIDALDEFGRSDADQLHLITHLLPRWTQMPPRCKLFIASRSQGILPRHLDLPVHRVRRLAIGDAASPDTINDIRSFFNHGLKTIQIKFDSSTALVTDSQLETLVKASSGLFIWASTVIQMVKQKSLFKSAKQFVRDLCTQHATAESTRMKPLYQLYRTVLDPLLDSEDAHDEPISEEMVIKQTFFSAVVCAKIPLSARGLSALCGATSDDIQDIARQLSPVMDYSCGLRFVHKSFTDYIMSEDFPLPLNFEAIEMAFIDSCFEIMDAQLRFNMGNIPSSYMLNSEIPTLREALSEELQYASRFWGPHLMDFRSRNKSNRDRFAQQIDDFLNRQFLYWIEAMSILGCFREAIEALSLVKAAGHGKKVRDFAQDGLSFLRQFAAPISQSYPHIYISAMPWTPTNSIIRTRYHETVSHVLRIASNGDEIWPGQLGVVEGHDDWVLSVAFSPDGSQIVSASHDNTIRIWDAATRQPIGELFWGHDDWVNSVAFSSDGSQIVSGSLDKTLRIWDAATRQPIGEPLRGHDHSVLSVAFSPDGSQIVSGSHDTTIRIWDVATRQPIGEPLRGHNDSVLSVAFSPDGSQIISGSSDNTIRIWDVALRQPIGEPLRGHNDSVRSVAFSPDGSQIVSGSSDKTVRIWDAATCQPIGEPLRGHDNWISCATFSPDGSQIVSASYDNTIWIWDAVTRQPIGQPFCGHKESVVSVAFSPDGCQIISGSSDNTIRIWDAAACQPIREPLRDYSDSVFSVAFSPSGSQIVSGSSDKTIRIWDVALRQPIGEPLRGHDSPVFSVALSPDGSQIVSGSADNTIRIWDAAACQPIGEPLRGHCSSVFSVAFSPDGSQIVSGSYDKTIRIWNVATRQPIGAPLLGHDNRVRSVVFSPDGFQIVSGSDDKTIRIWDAATRQPIGEPLRGHDDSVLSVAFSPDGSQIVSGSNDATIRIWDSATRQPIGDPLRGHDTCVFSIAFSPDGTQIVSGSGENTIRIWDALTRQPVGAPLLGHNGWVHSVAFSPDGSQIVSGSLDKTIRLWDATARHSIGKPIHALKTLSLSRISNSSPLTCFLLHDGWVVDPDNNRLVWIPHHHLYQFLPTPGLIDVIGRRRMIVIDASDMRTGEEWSSCVDTH